MESAPFKLTEVEKNTMPYLFTIVFKDSSSLSTIAKIDEHKGEFYLTINNAAVLRSIRPSETINIERLDENGFLYVGLPMDSCWLFRMKAAKKIKSYSVLAQKNPHFIIAIQKDEGPILPLNEENLLSMIEGESRKARKLIKAGKLVRALKAYNK